MILTDKDIKDAVKKGIIKIEPFDPSGIQPASYDFRVGKEGITTQGREKIDVEEKGIIILDPGDFGVISSLETVEMPKDHAARIGIRSYFSRQGLFAATGPQIDPGFKGRLFITVINLSPNVITLPYKEKFLTVEFHKLNEPVSKPYSGEFQDKLNMTDREIQNIIVKRGLAFSEIIKTLESMNRSIGALSSDVRTLKWIIPTVFAAGIALIAILINL